MEDQKQSNSKLCCIETKMIGTGVKIVLIVTFARRVNRASAGRVTLASVVRRVNVDRAISAGKAIAEGPPREEIAVQVVVDRLVAAVVGQAVSKRPRCVNPLRKKPATRIMRAAGFDSDRTACAILRSLPNACVAG